MAVKSYTCESDYSHKSCSAIWCQCDCHSKESVMEKPQWFSVVESGPSSSWFLQSNWMSFVEAEAEAKAAKKRKPNTRFVVMGPIAEIVEVPQPQFETKHYS